MAARKQAKARKAPTGKATKTPAAAVRKAVKRAGTSHAIHVDHNEALDRFDVVDHEGRVVGHGHDQQDAIDLAIAHARHLHGGGDEVVVCVERDDGHYTLAWSSR